MQLIFIAQFIRARCPRGGLNWNFLPQQRSPASAFSGCVWILKTLEKGAIFRFTHVRVFSLYYRYIYTFVCPVLIIYLLLAPCVLRRFSSPSRGPRIRIRPGQARAGRNYRLEILRHDTVIMELISTRNWIKACGSNRKPLSEKYKI